MKNIESYVFSDDDVSLSGSAANHILFFWVTDGHTGIKNSAFFEKRDVIAMAKHFNVTGEDLGA